MVLARVKSLGLGARPPMHPVKVHRLLLESLWHRWGGWRHNCVEVTPWDGRQPWAHFHF